jgi:hypothetical protein
MASETLPLKKGQGNIALADSRLKCMPQTKARSCKQYPQISISVGGLNLLSSKKEIVIKEDLLRPIEDHDLGFTQVDHRLTKVTKEGHGIQLSL